jgi:hypothetical protein
VGVKVTGVVGRMVGGMVGGTVGRKMGTQLRVVTSFISEG